MKTNKLILVLALLVTHLMLGQYIDKMKEFTKINDALKNPEKVYRLNLSDQKVDWSNVDWSRFKNLEYINLKNDHLIEIPVGLTTLKSLKTIDLSGNDFQKLPESFSNLINLEEVFLNDEKNIDLPKTLKILAKLPNLKSLHLENDNLSSLPSEMLLFKNLEFLYLNQNKFIEIPKLEPLNHLKFLDLSNNKIKPEFQDLQNINFGFKINF